MWLELELTASGEEVRISGRGSRGERPPMLTLPPEQGLDALLAFTTKVARAVRFGKALDPAVVKDAQALHEAVFAGELRDVLVRLGEASKDERLLVRLLVQDRGLMAVPWEALCKPGTTEGFLGTDPKVLVARGVNSSDPWEPREVRGAVRVLAIAPGSDDRAVAVLREALAPSIDVGEVEWLDPIAGPDINARALYDRLRRGKSPHVVHFLGHGGVDLSGRPVLRMADNEDGEEVWITAESLGRELSASFCEELRFVILEACEGAKAGALGSAAEILAKAGADAVVAHLWPVKADVARTCSAVLYRALTASDATQGDVGASVAAARRTLLSESAEAFSPILFLRGSDSVIFDFKGRRVSRPGKKKRANPLAPALQSLLEKPFTMVLGNVDDDRIALRDALTKYMSENGDTAAEGISLEALTQRFLLRFGQDRLLRRFQRTLSTSPSSAPPLIDAIARFVKPGVHITLLWRPYLEHAIAGAQPRRTVYAIQPSLTGSVGKPPVIKRAAGSKLWEEEPGLPKRFDFDNDIVVLRLYGGWSAEDEDPIFSHPLVTEDDHIQGLVGAAGFRPPSWMEELLARPRIQPGLFIGMSLLDWTHRMLLNWLYDQRPAPNDSLAILAAATGASEAGFWESGGWLPGKGRIAPIVEDPQELASMLDALDAGEAS